MNDTTPAAADPPAGPDDDAIRIGVSTCLLGEPVRYDGGHKRDPLLTHLLAQYVTFVAVCPEVELGLGVPRPTLRLVSGDDGPRMVFHDSDRDITADMQRFAARRVKALEAQDLCGYVLKSNSPSCGMERVRVYNAKGMPHKNGTGLFAAALLAHLPLLPVEEEGRLHDPALRENFLERVFAFHRVKRVFRGRWRPGDVVAFHTREKLLVLSHEPEGYRALGRLVADIQQHPRAEFAATYQQRYMQALGKHATRGRHTNVMQHMAGYLKDHLDADAKAELGGLIDDYRKGLLPLIVPVTLIRHHVRRFDVAYLADQYYLQPHPKELMLRNHV